MSGSAPVFVFSSASTDDFFVLLCYINIKEKHRFDQKVWLQDMDKRTRSGILLAFTALLAGYCIIGGMERKVPSERRESISFRTMGTVAGVVFYDPGAGVMQKGCDEVKAEFEKIIRIANLYDNGSELSRLNRTAYQKEFYCSDLLWQMILEAEYAFVFSGGAFDITVKPLMDLWGFYRKRGKAPDEKEIKDVLNKVGFNKLLLDRQKKTIRFTVQGMGIDLGGIAKGFALDLAAQKAALLVERGVIDLGGNLKFLGGKNNYLVGIKHPSSPEKLSGKNFYAPPGSSVSTSGDYERNVVYDGKVFGHIIDPVSGYPPVGKYSATVCCSSAMRADWLSTAVFLRGKLLAEKAEKEINPCHIILVEK